MRDRSTSVKGAHPVDAVPADGTNVLFDVWLLSKVATGALGQALSPSGLTADEFGVYSMLTSAETMTPSELARWLAAPPTTVSSYVKRFEARGHVTRERNPLDGRSFVLRLTPTGRRVHQEAGRAFLPVLEAVTAALGRQEPAVRRALAELRSALERAV